MGQTGIKKRRKNDYKNERRQKVIERQAYRRDRLKFKKIQNQPTRKSPYKQTNQTNSNKQPQLYIPSQKLLQKPELEQK